MSIRASAVILAGGRSRRMGRPKAVLPLGDTTILAHLIGELGAAFDDIVIVSAPRAQEPYAMGNVLKPEDNRIRIVRDAAPFSGPASALVAGLRAARHQIVFGCSCDLPLLRHSVAHDLSQMLDDFDAVIPVIDGREQPLCAVYRRSCANALETFLHDGEHRLTAIVHRLRMRRLEESELRKIDPQLYSFFNVNTPEEYAVALKIAHGE